MTNKAQVISMSVGFDYPGMVRALVDKDWPLEQAASRAFEAYRANTRLFDSVMDIIRAREAALGTSCVVVAAAGNESRRGHTPGYESPRPCLRRRGRALHRRPHADAGRPRRRLVLQYPSAADRPGTDIKSAFRGGGLGLMSGTSMAFPHVAGHRGALVGGGASQATARDRDMVTAAIIAACRVDGFAPNVDRAARGSGLVTAP